MKKNEIIELNGVEYTLELNRNYYMAKDLILVELKSIKQ